MIRRTSEIANCKRPPTVVSGIGEKYPAVLGFGSVTSSAILRRLVMLLALALYCVVFVAGQPITFTGRVVAVIDGDTIGVMRDGREVRIRLEGIDAPENGQDFSQRAKQFTSAAIFGKAVSVGVKETDRYGRLLARVVADGQDVSVALVEAGLAWHYLEYSNDAVLSRAELSARSRKVGLWSIPNPTPPWAYRNDPLPATVKASETQRPITLLTGFLGNTRSNVVHAQDCPSLKNCKYCTLRFDTVAAAIKAGYRAHSGRGGCLYD